PDCYFVRGSAPFNLWAFYLVFITYTNQISSAVIIAREVSKKAKLYTKGGPHLNKGFCEATTTAAPGNHFIMSSRVMLLFCVLLLTSMIGQLPHAQGTGCSRPSGWCIHKGSVARNVDCDRDGALDWACSDNAGGRWAILSKNKCAADWSGGKPTSICPAAFGCSKPPGWCVHTGSVLKQLDCDGDGVLDLACSDNTGRRWAILSKNNCAEDWIGGKPVSICPNGFGCFRPAGWCVQKGSVARNVDCDGDGALDWACSDSNGGRWAILSKNGCAEDWIGGRPLSICPKGFGK
ncbi:hypothetical protein Vretifemale_12302, partial [Volvox reticuliferus]